MNTVPLITPGSITRMNGLKTRPVFFITLGNSPTPNLVIKGEPGGQSNNKQDREISIKWSSKIMKNINNRLVNSKIMNPGEINTFIQFATNAFQSNTPQYNFAINGRDYHIWVKMPFVAGLSDADYRNEDPTYVDGKAIDDIKSDNLKEGLGKLLSEKVWQDLGKIVAVDIFNGNADRFNPLTGTWANQGNIMFLENGLTAAIGLDTFDPNAMTLKNDKIGNATSNFMSPNTYEPLRTLSEAGYRNQFARKCLKSMADTYKDAFQKIGMGSTSYKIKGLDETLQLKVTTESIEGIFMMYLDDFENGLAMGADQLRRYLINKVHQYRGTANQQNQQALAVPQRPATAPPLNRIIQAPARPGAALPQGNVKTLPPGVIARMKYLNWLR